MKFENVNTGVVKGFGDEWQRFDQSQVKEAELSRLFNSYFHIFPWESLPPNAVGFDLGCGSGRWAKLAATRVGQLHLIDPSAEALNIARRNLQGLNNCEFHCASVDAIPIADGSADFGYSLGVLHHIPNTQRGIECCVAKLKSGAPFLIYLYYAFDNRPRWFKLIWKASEVIRWSISRLPLTLRYAVSQFLAGMLYWPLARTSLLLEKLGINVASFPLSEYRRRSFYIMRNDALDRFGTQLEQRFTKIQIEQMMERAGLQNITFSHLSFWTAVGYKK